MKRLACLTPLLLAACSRNPSAVLDAASPSARATGWLFWFFLAVNGVIWLLVLGFLFYFLWRRREPTLTAPLIQADAAVERKLITRVGLAIGATVIILTLFVGISYAVDRQLLAFQRRPQLEIEVTAHQWWWEVRYLSDQPSDIFVTANEIHVPLNTRVKLKLQSTDVIHSLWFPNLSGKRDIIPGHDGEMVILADRAGVWKGRCGEFCGLQHTYMELRLVAEPKAQFQTWEAAQRLPAADPVTAEALRGQQVFNGGPCATCHAIRTTTTASYSTNAPDLTHLKSRTTIGAGAAPNTKGYLSGWINDPHAMKPGVHMPAIQQNSKDHQALLAYLEGLK